MAANAKCYADACRQVGQELEIANGRFMVSVHEAGRLGRGVEADRFERVGDQ
jgi:hypothetical protein